MAYNLESLIQILDEILHPHHRHPWVLASENRTQIESLLEKARCLNELFQNYFLLVIRSRIEVLESRIRDAVYEAEDIIESHLVDRTFFISPPDLHKVIEEFDFVKEELTKLSDRYLMGNSSSSLFMSSRADSRLENIVVGISKDLIQLKERLNAPQRELQIIPIVGMGGIGKTTLARNLYDDPSIVFYFDKRAWITISQEYNLKEVLLGLLQCLVGNLKEEMIKKEAKELVSHLHKTLFSRRYLIVLDDMWSFRVWDDIRRCFPDDEEGSRILVTTREMSVANYVGSQGLHHQMNFLNDVESWNLLCKKVFADETCPIELEEIGKEIVTGCAGLPLAIHVIGGLLAQIGRDRVSWQLVENGIGRIVAREDKKFSIILSFSYDFLPSHLKPCFLYMGTFPEDDQIRPSKLIRLWVAEGFIKPILGKSLEEAAELYLKALVDRNLLLVHQEEVKGKAKSYIMHDLLRDFCINKAEEEKFINVWPSATRGNKEEEKFINVWPSATRGREDRAVRRENIHGRLLTMKFPPGLSRVTRSLLYLGSGNWLDPYRNSNLSFDILKLVRVVHILNMNLSLHVSEDTSFGPFPKLLNLRYLAFRFRSELGLSYRMPTCRNLQTMILHDQGSGDVIQAAPTIIHMPRLRHVKFEGQYPLLDLPPKEDVAPHEELQTLSTVAVDKNFTRAILAFPNLKKLGVVSIPDIAISSNIDLTCLTKLETLKCSSEGDVERFEFFSFLIFPLSLKKLTLKKGRIPIEFMETIGTLPNLEVLKLQHCTFTSPTWEPTEDQFCKLKLLLLEDADLVNWIADETHYPGLEQLIIRDCSQLEEIPCDIGAIDTLQKIEVHGNIKPSALESARRIQDEQLDYGNDLQVRITP